MHRLPLNLIPLPLLAGCDLLGDLAGYANPMVMEATLVGVETPDPALVDLTGTTLEGGTVATVLLADATQMEDLAEAPLAGARVELRIDDGEWRALRDESEGKYLLDEGLTYVAGQAVAIRIQGDPDHGATVRAPDVLDVTVAAEHAAGAPLVVQTEAEGIAHLALVVMDIAAGEVLFDNRPTSIEDIYALTHGGGQRAVEVPGVVFSRPGAYVVGVAGLAVSAEEDLDNLNTTISALTAGTIRFYPVTVGAWDEQE